MSSLKTKVDDKDVLSFLNRYFKSEISELTFLKGGEISQAFSFRSENKRLVLRVNSDNTSFLKDKYAYEHFSDLGIPIPRVLDIGLFDNSLFFALSEESVGKNLDQFDHKKLLLSLTPALFSVLSLIHKTPVQGSGFGNWNKDGVAAYKSWQDFLSDNEYFLKDTEGLSGEIFEKDIALKICDAIAILASEMPDVRYLVHGDYGFSNVMSDGKHITGVLDWGESLYGDFIYDIAWLQFWSDITYGELFKKYYEGDNGIIPNYERRMICYQLKLGLGAIHFFARSGQKESYIWTRDKLLKLVKML